MSKIEKKRRAFKLATQLAKYAWNDFAKSLVEFYNEAGFLTDKQIIAGRNLVTKAQENQWGESSPPLPVTPFKEEEVEPEPVEEPF